MSRGAAVSRSMRCCCATARACGVRITDGDAVESIEAARWCSPPAASARCSRARTNPAGADGAGLALALAAGAQVRDLEFVQFHPTALDVAGTSLPLVTEALRGAGARLRDDHGHALMAGVHPLGDLAPRDVVARRVWQAQREGRRVLLEARGAGRSTGRAHSRPCWRRASRTASIRACRPIPVTPAAHFHMGGVACDALGAHFGRRPACGRRSRLQRRARRQPAGEQLAARRRGVRARLGAWLASRAAPPVAQRRDAAIAAPGRGLSPHAMADLARVAVDGAGAGAKRRCDRPRANGARCNGGGGLAGSSGARTGGRCRATAGEPGRALARGWTGRDAGRMCGLI